MYKQEYLEFSADVKRCFEENKKRYGAIKIHLKLAEKGIPCSIKRVQRHMKRKNLHTYQDFKERRKALF